MAEEIRDDKGSGIILKDFFFQISKNIYLFLIIIFVFTLSGSIYEFYFKDVTYTAEAATMVSVSNGANSSGDYSNYMYATNLIPTFQVFIVSDPVLGETINILNNKGYNNISAKEIENKTTVTTSSSRLIINIAYVSEIPQEAIDVVNALVDATITISNTKIEEDGVMIYKYKDLAGNFMEMNYATATTESSGTIVIIIVSFLIGLIIALLTVLIKYLLNDTYTSKNNFENDLGISVLAFIPK